MEHRAHSVLHHELMNRHLPAGSVLRKAFRAIGILSAPLHERRRIGTTPHVLAKSPDQMVNEDKLERCRAL